MEVRKTIKKVVALAAGASMVGATLFGASAAADLANYPNPFIKEGVFDAVLVVGDKAKAEDVIGVTDIAVSLQFASKTVKKAATSTSTKTVVEGDKWLVGTSGDKLELGEAFDKAISRASSSDLKALAGGSITNTKGTATYEQYFRLAGTPIAGGTVGGTLATSGTALFEEDTDTDVVADYAKWTNTGKFFNYSLDFTAAFESDVENSSGNADTSGTYLTDFEDSSINLGSKKYTILTARRNAANNAGLKLTLLGGDVSDSLAEGETKTYNLNGKDYEVTNVIVTDVTPIYVQLKINGVLTKNLQASQTDRLKDGTILGIKKILSSEAGDVSGDIAEFTLGANKVELQDNFVGNSAVDSSVLKINDDSIGDADVIIKGSDDNSTFKINNILINYKSDDNYWLPAGKKLSEILDTEPKLTWGALGLDVLYSGLSNEDSETIEIQNAGDDKYDLKLTTNAGKITVPLAYDNSSTGTTLALFGDNSNKLKINPTNASSGNSRIARNEYFILTDKTNTVDGYSEVVQYKSGDKSTRDNPKLKLKLLSSGETVERTLTVAAPTASATLTVGGYEYTLANGTDYTLDDFDLIVTTAAAANGPAYNKIVTKGGALVTLSPINNSIDLLNGNTNLTVIDKVVITVVDTNKLDARAQPSFFNYSVTASATDDMLSLSRNGGVVTSTIKEDSNVAQGMNEYGAKATFTSQSSKPQVLKIDWPKNQRLPQVYLLGGAVTTTTAASGGDTVTEVVKIDVGATKLASQVADAKAQNVILVGGPCANAATAAVVSKPFVNGEADATCADGYSAGKAVIQLFEHLHK
ncbi:S-layer protein [Candidatus Woesearchaeota archaeon]|nr:S-layer protein [Candidatus Woesearchaeota archaeon]